MGDCSSLLTLFLSEPLVSGWSGKGSQQCRLMGNHKGDLITKESPSFTEASEVKTYLLLGTQPFQFASSSVPCVSDKQDTSVMIVALLHYNGCALPGDGLLWMVSGWGSVQMLSSPPKTCLGHHIWKLLCSRESVHQGVVSLSHGAGWCAFGT